MTFSKRTMQGVTLIELLIVVAIIMISSCSYIGIQVYMMRQRLQLSKELDATSEEHQILNALLHDFAGANRIVLNAGTASTATPVEQGAKVVVRFISGSASKESSRPQEEIVYRVEGTCLIRQAKASLTLSKGIDSFQVERRGKLLHIAVACKRPLLPGEAAPAVLETDCVIGDKMP